ncbi:unnamed protein product, partial [Brugia timori]|uniref:High-affinity choline transporter 1-like n=1 Tax=Brugia timori TaxID=42155 RepID=A0A0R3QSH8_9BILA
MLVSLQVNELLLISFTATWVGGAYINGTAEALYNGGLLGCQAPFGYALSLVIGGILFAKKMRDEGYITMLDPFQVKYGQRVGGLLFIPALLGEVFWTAAILSALGATLSVILAIDMTLSVIISAIIAVFYTFTGGLYAVAYTDVVQLFCIFVGLWVCVPASLLQDKTKDLSRNAADWIGTIGGFKETTLWIDCMLLLIFGGIPWQAILSSKSSSGAQKLSFVAGIGCILMAIPPALIGAIARNTDWRLTNYNPWNNGTKSESILVDQTNMVVPLKSRLGAVSAAVMSSADSSVLSAASMFAHNIWKLAIRPNVAVGFCATLMALTINSIYGLWYLCADLVYVILFPQLVCVVYFKHSNTYGSVTGYIVGLLLRLSGGEPLLSFPAFIHYPMYEEVIKEDGTILGTQFFPFRTMAMLGSFIACIGISYLSEYLFANGILPVGMDFLKCVVNIPPERIALHSDVSFNVSSETLNAQRAKDSGDNYTRRNFLKPPETLTITEL